MGSEFHPWNLYLPCHCHREMDGSVSICKLCSPQSMMTLKCRKTRVDSVASLLESPSTVILLGSFKIKHILTSDHMRSLLQRVQHLPSLGPSSLEIIWFLCNVSRGICYWFYFNPNFWEYFLKDIWILNYSWCNCSLYMWNYSPLILRCPDHFFSKQLIVWKIVRWEISRNRWTPN